MTVELPVFQRRRLRGTGDLPELDPLRWLDLTVEVADRAGVLARRHMRSHPGVDSVDYLVAAATQILGARLETRNVKHFPMFPKLAPAYR